MAKKRGLQRQVQQGLEVAALRSQIQALKEMLQSVGMQVPPAMQQPARAPKASKKSNVAASQQPSASRAQQQPSAGDAWQAVSHKKAPKVQNQDVLQPEGWSVPVVLPDAMKHGCPGVCMASVSVCKQLLADFSGANVAMAVLCPLLCKMAPRR